MNAALAHNDHVARVAILGGGITGLAAAYRIRDRAPGTRFVLLEASDRFGGVIRTEKIDGWLVEHGPDSLLREKPWAIDLCQRLDLGDALIPTQEQHRQTLIVRKGRVVPVPDAFRLLAPTRLAPFLLSRALSWRGRLRALGDLVLPRRPAGVDDESLASFVRRRLGNEVLTQLAQPLVGGIYSADPETLSLAATMPRFLDLERRHRSIILGLMREATASAQPSTPGTSGARFSIFYSLEQGLGALPDALAACLPIDALRTGCRATALTRSDEGWRIETTGGSLEADAVVVALPAPKAAELLAGFDPELADRIAAIRCTSTAVVNLAYPATALSRPLTALGLVVPATEGRGILAASVSSLKYAGRAPAGGVLVRAFLGGALGAAVLSASDDDLIALARRELADFLGLRGEPLFSRCTRWPNSMPQYAVGHLERKAEIFARAARHPAFALAGNAYDGVGLADCVRSGTEAADHVLDALADEGRKARAG